MSSRAKRRLVNLRLNRVDLVPKGANPGALVTLYKQEEEAQVADTEEVQETPEEVQPEESSEEVVEETVVEEEPEAEVAKAEVLTLRAELQKSNARIEKMERDRLTEQFVAKAASELDSLGSAQELGMLLLSVHEHCPKEQAQTLERVLKAANAQASTGGLFEQFGREGEQEPDSFEAKVLKLAKEKVQAGEAKTVEIGKQLVIDENPDLRSEYAAQWARR